MEDRSARKSLDSESGPTTAVVIATYKRASFLERVLEDLAAAPLPSEIHEVLIVENGARDGTESLCERFAGRLPIRYHFVEEAGKSNALNVALHSTGARFIILYDDDVRVAPSNPHAFVAGARTHGPGHFFGGPVEPEYEGAPPPEWLHPWLTTCVVGWSLGDQEQLQNEFLGANWAAFKDDLLAAGGFVKGLGPNAAYRTVGQEVEMQERLVARGCRGVYLPQALVQHHVPAHQGTVQWVRNRWRQQSLSRVMLEPRHLEAPRLWGVPRFLWRNYLTELALTLSARVMGPRSARRMRHEMQLAATVGQIMGYRRVARVGRFAVPEG